MLKFLLFILLLVGFIIFFVIVSLLGVVRSLFGFGRKKQPDEYERVQNDEYNSPTKTGKVFGNNEGEYVDFEEVKEENKEKANL